MSRTKPAFEHISVPNGLMLPQAARYLAAIAASRIASIVVRRAKRQAYRQLAAVDDRTLRDMGLVRAELMSLLEALAETRTAVVFSQFPWNRPRMGA